MESIIAALQSIAKPKQRSYDTSLSTHIPLLQSQTQKNNVNENHGPVVVLVGDSMLERMTTTGECPNFTAPWPSPAMLDDTTLASLALGPGITLKRIDKVFNAGVGGDRIQNIAYRLAGGPHLDDPTNQPGLPALLPLLAACGSVRLWVVQAGSNNLTPKRGLKDADRDALRVLVAALLRVEPEGRECRVLVTGLFYRLDVKRELVDEANEKVRGVVRVLNEEFGGERVVFLPAAKGVKAEEHLVDHVHLSLEGYQVWMRELFPAVVGLLR
jgi:platelet-activating factor acetylhydrolase IB subunit beta/gamma